MNDYVPGYTHMFRTFGRLFSERIKRFGGYKKIVKLANLRISNFFKASDGHILSSYYEFLFDEFLYFNNIPHEIDGRIIPSSRCRYDFKIGNLFVEIWGFNDNASKHYLNYVPRRKAKENLYSVNGLKLLGIEGNEFGRSSTELQSFFKSELAKHGVTANDKLVSYPIFNRRKLGYWCDETILEEIKMLIPQFGRIPTSRELDKINRTDLSGTIVKHGGYRKFAALLGFEPKTKKFSEPYVIKELDKIKIFLGHFPCDRELQEMKRGGLAGLIKSHGGYGYFKELIDGNRDKKPFGYWNDENNLIKELKILTSKLGKFPKYNELGLLAKGINKSKKGMKYFESQVLTEPGQPSVEILMKNNTHLPKHHLAQALNSLPQDNALAEARSLIRQALARIEHTEKKRAQREPLAAQTNWNELLHKGLAQGGLLASQHGSSSQRTIDILNELIAEEQRKLNALAQQTPGKNDGDDELQTIHG